MKNLLTALFTFCTILVFADIPRVDIMEVTYQGKTYYSWEFTAHLIFKEGCVFDRQSNEYLYEDHLYFHNNYNRNTLMLYKELISIPKQKIFQNYNPEDTYYSKHLFHLTGDTIELRRSNLDSIDISKIHIGNEAGYDFPTELRKSDEDWILDYSLEKIANLDDSYCQFELFAIKGNISKKEAKGIKAELTSLYKAMHKSNNYKGKKPHEYINELLKRNILMIGFCSC